MLTSSLARSALFLSCLAMQTSLFSAVSAPVLTENADTNKEPKFTAKDYSSLLGMKGFSDKALNNHFKLYKGYVTNAQLILDNLKASEGKSGGPAIAEQRRRLGWEFDGMRLHEYYFDNLGGEGTNLENSHPLYILIEKNFGSFDAWKKDFINTGMMRGIGWAILYQDPKTNRLINVWINEHDLGHLAGATPLLTMDVFEHAYLTDYELDRDAYIKAFMNNVNWEVVKQRYAQSNPSQGQ